MPITATKETTRRHQANQRIHALTRTQYFETIPLDQIKTILAEQGFATEPLNGVYCGASGEADPVQVGNKTWCRISWYRMPSGRYEITCYLS